MGDRGAGFALPNGRRRTGGRIAGQLHPRILTSGSRPVLNWPLHMVNTEPLPFTSGKPFWLIATSIQPPRLGVRCRTVGKNSVNPRHFYAQPHFWNRRTYR